MDLGATPGQSIRRVLLPLLSRRRSSRASPSSSPTWSTTSSRALPVRRAPSSETLAVKIYSASRGSPTPEVNAAATVMLIATMTRRRDRLLCSTVASAEGPGGRRGDASSCSFRSETEPKPRACRPRFRRPRAHRSRCMGVPASGSTRSASLGSARSRGRQTRRARAAFVLHPGLDALARGEVHDHLQHRTRRRRRARPCRAAGSRRSCPAARGSTRSGRIVTFACPRVSSSPWPAMNSNSPIVTRQPPSPWPCASASIRFDTPRKSAT